MKDLYEIRNTNRLLLLKRKILPIKMEENETISSFISQIKYLKNKLVDISEIEAHAALVTITMNGMTDNY